VTAFGRSAPATPPRPRMRARTRGVSAPPPALAMAIPRSTGRVRPVVRFPTVADYLFTRLEQLGIGSVFGVPGDYNLALLDRLGLRTKLGWVGTCTELGAAYAADGYARVQGFGALLTTFGVGELSALNGVAGAFAEHVPIVAITGAPPRRDQFAGRLLHHSLGDGDFGFSERMFRSVTVAQTQLDPDNAAAEIDRVLAALVQERRPVYISLPTDVVESSAPPVRNTLSHPGLLSHPEMLEAALLETLARLHTAQDPILMVGPLIGRFDLQDATRELVEEAGLPFVSSPSAKGLLDETASGFLGVYQGGLSTPATRSAVEGSDFLLELGARPSDFDSGGFTTHLDPTNVVEVGRQSVRIGDTVFPHVYLEEFLPRLRIRASSVPSGWERRRTPRSPPEHADAIVGGGTGFGQDVLWAQMSEFLREDDIVIADTGTSGFGALGLSFPARSRFLLQPLWASIGWSVGALLGASMASPESRCLLFVGDGAFQLTGSEISVLLRRGLTPTVFLLNNHGYSVERVIHRPQSPYNDIPNWDYAALVRAWGQGAWCTSVGTALELRAALLEVGRHPRRFNFVEIRLGMQDAPRRVMEFGKILSGSAPP
jgi:TPP-dependent 2-oxoacid decarboxylase